MQLASWLRQANQFSIILIKWHHRFILCYRFTRSSGSTSTTAIDGHGKDSSTRVGRTSAVTLYGFPLSASRRLRFASGRHPPPRPSPLPRARPVFRSPFPHRLAQRRAEAGAAPRTPPAPAELIAHRCCSSTVWSREEWDGYYRCPTRPRHCPPPVRSSLHCAYPRRNPIPIPSRKVSAFRPYSPQPCLRRP